MAIKTNVSFVPVALSGPFNVIFSVGSPLTRAVLSKLWLFNNSSAEVEVTLYVNDTPDLTTPTLVDGIAVGPFAGRSVQSVVGYAIPAGWYILAAASASGVNAIYSSTDYSGNS
jgi:hypothetical protein